ncbi:hypothetical protein PAESOLCIP111_01201 [Paenibacillus solanacearum]|uniref:Uncharacterized protein n=1 Tax=Paenibacillus solanacearum TaxID=2048548 RepID=A0A916NHG3_9BACL|nr:hypothetical protein PAESOLCIP111_01201 [Paenibacillus solanacearum]
MFASGYIFMKETENIESKMDSFRSIVVVRRFWDF